MHPYNVQALGNDLYVEYASVGVGGSNNGLGMGYVDVYDMNGNLISSLVKSGTTGCAMGCSDCAGGFRPVRERSAGRQFRKWRNQRIRSEQRQLSGDTRWRERERYCRKRSLGAGISAEWRSQVQTPTRFILMPV